MLLFHFIILDSHKHYTAHTDEVIDGEILFLDGFVFVGFLFQRIEEVVVCIGVLFIFLFLVFPHAVIITPFQSLTPEGEALARRTARRVIQAENQVFAAWPQEDVEQYLALTRRFQEALGEKAKEIKEES